MGYGGGGGGGDGQRPIRILGGNNPPVYYASLQQRPKGFLSDEEKKNLGIATAALTICFSVVMFRWNIGPLSDIPSNMGDFLFILVLSFIVTSTGFALHEMAHKFVAQKYGCWAEFRYSTQGLMFALVLAIGLGVLFAAPGAVYIVGAIDKRQNGIISIAGPLTNVGVTLAMIPMYLWGGDWLSIIAYWVIFFNMLLALFNMIPVMPLDGAKVLKWNIPLYAVSLVAMGALLYFTRIVLPEL